MTVMMRDIPPTWLVSSEIFPGKEAIRLHFDKDHTYYVIIDFEEVIEAVKWRKQNEPKVKNWKHNIPLKHEDYLVIHTSPAGKTHISKIPAIELVIFAATCTVEDDLEIEE